MSFSRFLRLGATLRSKTISMQIVRPINESIRVRRQLSTTGNKDFMAPVITKTSGKSKEDSINMAEDEWVEWVQSLEPMDIERELHKVKRAMGSYYTLGHYGDALNSALKLERVIDNTIGRMNPVYASCLNNIALMNKMLGHNDVAVTKYTEALQVYEGTVGKEHASYASTLSNVGILYRTMSEGDGVKGMERLEHLDSAEEALQSALDIRIALAPNKSMSQSREALNSAMNLAMVKRLQSSKSSAADKAANKCEETLQEVLQMCRELCGNNDSMTAVVLSNLGIVLKARSKFSDASKAYTEALNIRSSTLGDAHPDSIVSMHNLAELYLAMNEQEKSEQMQQAILDILDKNPTPTQPKTQPGLQAKQPWDDEEKEIEEKIAAADKTMKQAGPPVTFATRKKKPKKK
jgi:tetratricopeptide (TPR) repeat protein